MQHLYTYEYLSFLGPWNDLETSSFEKVGRRSSAAQIDALLHVILKWQKFPNKLFLKDLHESNRS